MESRREFLTGVLSTITILAGCTGGDGDDDRPCADVDGGCGPESAAQLMEHHIHENNEFDIEVEVDGNFLSRDDLSATHTTTGGSITGDSSTSGEILNDISTVAWWYAAAVNDEFEVADLSAEIIYSFNSPDPLGTYMIQRDWAEQFVTDEWSENEYYTTVYETLDT